MRPKYCLAILSVGGVFLLGAAFVSSRWSEPAAVPSINTPPNAAPASRKNQRATVNEHAPVSVTPNASEAIPLSHAATIPKSDPDADNEKHEAYVEARTAQLRNLARKSDGASVATLLSEVGNADREIREAALDALTQSGNRTVIPALEAKLAQTESAEEKKAIRDVIEFLKLPTLTETLRGLDAASRR